MSGFASAFLIALGVWGLCQITKGQALERLKVVSS